MPQDNRHYPSSPWQKPRLDSHGQYFNVQGNGRDLPRFSIEGRPQLKPLWLGGMQQIANGPDGEQRYVYMPYFNPHGRVDRNRWLGYILLELGMWLGGGWVGWREKVNEALMFDLM